MVRRASLVLLMLAVVLMVAGCSKLSYLYVYNPTDSPISIVSDCGQLEEMAFEAVPGEWTKGGGCFKPMSWTIWVKGEELALRLVAPTKSRSHSYLDDTFLRVESKIVVETNAPISHVLKQPIAYLFLLFFCALPIVGLMIWRLFGQRRDRTAISSGR